MRLRMTAGVVLVLLGVSSDAWAQRKPGTSSARPCTVEFRNAPDDAIQDDGRPYVDGVEGVVCVISTAGGTLQDDLSLYFENKSKRRLVYAARPGNGLHPGWSQFSDGGSLRVKSIATVPAGVEEPRAFISYSGVGRFVASDEGSAEIPGGATDVVLVYRVDQCRWEIAFDPADSASGAALMELYDGAQWKRFRGVFAMPLAMTVTQHNCTP